MAKANQQLKDPYFWSLHLGWLSRLGSWLNTNNDIMTPTRMHFAVSSKAKNFENTTENVWKNAAPPAFTMQK